MDETLKKALEALKAAKRSMAMVIDETGGPHWGRKLMNASLSCAESERKVNAAIAAIEQHKPVVRMPPFGSKRAAALALYRPPFTFRMGYIRDAGGHMVADQDGFGEGSKVFDSVAARVRGWGRIGYMPDAEALQDEVGVVIAEALTAYWNNAKINGLTIGEHG